MPCQRWFIQYQELQNALSSKNFPDIGYYAISSEDTERNIPNKENWICPYNQVEYFPDLSIFLMPCNSIPIKVSRNHKENGNRYSSQCRKICTELSRKRSMNTNNQESTYRFQNVNIICSAALSIINIPIFYFLVTFE